MRTGDLCGTGTISGSTPDSYGSMLELSWNGQNSIKLCSGNERTFITDGDTVLMSGACERDNIRIGFGECICPVLPGKL
jgi:fumarylacetoacetase